MFSELASEIQKLQGSRINDLQLMGAGLEHFDVASRGPPTTDAFADGRSDVGSPDRDHNAAHTSSRNYAQSDDGRSVEAMHNSRGSSFG